jgi:alkanesulfonate monooxygenase SsuD/methylene tetrahydromethanopterin reductase-like flavin-dependent oxidoreductase (luciferase family)
MDFSTMVLSMYVDSDDDVEFEERVLEAAVGQSLLAGELGLNPWYTEHHFRGPWNAAPLQFAAWIAPQIPPERYLGFGVVSVPFHHPVRLVEQMNQLDQLTKGKTLFGMGSGFPGLEPATAWLDPEYHKSGQAARDSLEVMEKLWDYKSGDEPYEFETGAYRGRVVKRVVPAAYHHRRPTIIRTARNDAATVEAAQHGWPIFLGHFGADMSTQLPLYRQTLAEAGHTPQTVAECTRWSTVDWLSVVIGEREQDIPDLIAKAGEERMALRQKFLARSTQPVVGPARTTGGANPTAQQFANGGDMFEVVSGTPEQIAEKVHGLQELGVNHLMLRFMGEYHGETRWIAEQSMRLFSEQVMPQFVGDGQDVLAGRP